MNLYSYVTNDPVNKIDPYGEFCLTEAGATFLLMAFILAAIIYYPIWDEGIGQKGGNPVPSLADLGIYYGISPTNYFGRGPKVPPMDDLYKIYLLLQLIHNARKFFDTYKNEKDDEPSIKPNYNPYEDSNVWPRYENPS